MNARELIADIGSNSAAVDVIVATAPSRLKELVGRTQTPHEFRRWQLSAARPPACARS